MFSPRLPPRSPVVSPRAEHFIPAGPQAVPHYRVSPVSETREFTGSRALAGASTLGPDAGIVHSLLHHRAYILGACSSPPRSCVPHPQQRLLPSPRTRHGEPREPSPSVPQLGPAAAAAASAAALIVQSPRRAVVGRVFIPCPSSGPQRQNSAPSLAECATSVLGRRSAGCSRVLSEIQVKQLHPALSANGKHGGTFAFKPATMAAAPEAAPTAPLPPAAMLEVVAPTTNIPDLKQDSPQDELDAPPDASLLADLQLASPMSPVPRMPQFRGSTSLRRQRKSLRRAPMSELPLLHEERALDSNFKVTMLLPLGPLGQEFSDCLRAGFLEAEDTGVYLGERQDRLLVPYADSRIALVTIHQLGPVKALEYARRVQPAMADLGGREATNPLPSQELLEMPDEMSALSSALVYVVCRQRAVDSAEQQLGPICAVEASYAASLGHHPWRFVAAVHDGLGRGGKESFAGCSPGPFGEEVLRELQSRRVCGELPCRAVLRGDIGSHRALLIYIVDSLAAHFHRVTSPQKRSQGSDHGGSPCTGFANDVGKASGTCLSAEATTATPGSSLPSSPGFKAPAWPVSLR